MRTPDRRWALLLVPVLMALTIGSIRFGVNVLHSLVGALLDVPAKGIAQGQPDELGAFSAATPACVRENGCTVPACFGAAPGGATIYYVCDCDTAGASGQQPAAGCTAGNDGAAGTSPATAWRHYSKAQAQFGSLNAGDRILFCNGGSWDLTGTASTRWVNRNASAGTPVVVAYYQPSWGVGTEGRPMIKTPFGTYAFNLDDGSSVARGGYIFAGLAIQGLNQPATPCASSSPFPFEAFFVYDKANNVTICDTDQEYLCIGGENAGGNIAGDDNINLSMRNNNIANNGAQGFLGGGTNQTIDSSLFVNNGFETANLDHQIYLSAGGATGMAVTNCEMYRAAQVGGRCSGVMLVAHGVINSLVISGNYMHEDPGNATGSCYCIAPNPGYTTFEGYQNVTIKGNVVKNCGGAGVDLSACHTCLVENNICLADPLSGFECVALTNDGQGSGGGDFDNMNVSMANNDGYGFGTSFRISDTGTLMSSYNNVSYQTGTGTVSCFNYTLSNAAYSGINNNWCLDPSASTLNWNVAQSLTTWRLNGWDLNSTQGVAPAFTNARLSTSFTGAAQDFTPTVGSPLLHAGSTSGATIDFYGNPRPSPPAIGALEANTTNSISIAWLRFAILLMVGLLTAGAVAATIHERKKRRRQGAFARPELHPYLLKALQEADQLEIGPRVVPLIEDIKAGRRSGDS